MTIGDRAPDHEDSADESSSSVHATSGVFSHKIFNGPAKLPKGVDWEGNSEARLSRFEEHWNLLRDFFSIVRIKEDEDELTDKYVDMLGPRGTKSLDGTTLPLPADYVEDQLILPRWNYEGGKKDHWHMDDKRYLLTPVDLRDETLPRMFPTTDKYTVATFYFLRARLAGEKIESARKALYLFVLSLVSMALCAVIVGLGSSELDGGRVEVVVASYVLGMVGLISQICCIMGVLAMNEAFLRKYWIASLWMLSISVTYLYTEIHHAYDNRRICEPTLSNFATRDTNSCANEESVTLAALVLNIVLLALIFSSVYNTAGLLDSINDQASIEDNLHVAKYFQVYTTELTERMISGKEKLMREANSPDQQ
eukprot:TRINITY_DN21131_c0_g1_i1.p1 TRINITY_DN21131_c0_g1~~TRINITY_DN21131_c0_g1_i1.p1  ORF type:complete len:382 (+),score=74.71 TRINITY_DN21131_c0_g1_i1:47-1147(+)